MVKKSKELQLVRPGDLGPQRLNESFLRLYHFIMNVLMSPLLTKYESNVILLLLDETVSWNHPYCLLSRQTIAKRCHMHPVDVSKTIKSLKEKNFIFYNPKGRDNQYHVNFDQFKESAEKLSEQAEKKHPSKRKKSRGLISVGESPTELKSRSVGESPTHSVGESPTESVGESPTEKIASKSKKIIKNKKLGNSAAAPIEISIEILIDLSLREREFFTHRWGSLSKAQAERERRVFSDLLGKRLCTPAYLIDLITYLEKTGKDFTGEPLRSVAGLLSSSFPLCIAHFDQIQKKEKTKEQSPRVKADLEEDDCDETYEKAQQAIEGLGLDPEAENELLEAYKPTTCFKMGIATPAGRSIALMNWYRAEILGELTQ